MPAVDLLNAVRKAAPHAMRPFATSTIAVISARDTYIKSEFKLTASCYLPLAVQEYITIAVSLFENFSCLNASASDIHMRYRSGKTAYTSC